jgi:hypothetical protein
VAGAGFEPTPESSGNSRVADQSGAECGALGAQTDPIDADLAAVVEAWATLPEPIKAGVLALVKAAK